MPQYLLDLSGDVLDIQWELAAPRWKQMRALEIVWAELCDEFDGEDIVQPDRRGYLKDAKSLIQRLFQAGPRRKWPEPEPELVENFRQHVLDVLGMWSLVTKEPK
jgi:hypothetical protein